MRTSGNVGTLMDMERIDDMQVGGDVTGDIEVILNASSGHIGGSSSVPNIIYGDMLGELTVGGDIRSLEIRGSFGNPSGSTKSMRVYGEIRNLTIGEVLNGAVIEARDGSNNLTSVQTFIVDDQWGASGDMDGELIAADVEPLEVGGIPLIDIKGDLNGVIDLASAFDARMLVGGSFGSNAEINLPANGLEGQISFNTANGSATWAGDLSVGSTTYPEDYAALPSAIGGGAAGLAPFTMHTSTASPVYDANVVVRGYDIYDPEIGCDDFPFDDPITFRLYGPAALVSGTGPHANVEIWNGSSWVDAGFDVETEIVSSTGSRGLKFTRKDGSGNPIAWPITPGEYRIVPVSGRITSTDVTGTPTVDFDYRINLLDFCEEQLLGSFDLNQDQTLCSQDTATWLSAPSDLNGDSNADTDDLTALMQAIDTYNTLN